MDCPKNVEKVFDQILALKFTSRSKYCNLVNPRHVYGVDHQNASAYYEETNEMCEDYDLSSQPTPAFLITCVFTGLLLISICVYTFYSKRRRQDFIFHNRGVIDIRSDASDPGIRTDVTQISSSPLLPQNGRTNGYHFPMNKFTPGNVVFEPLIETKGMISTFLISN